MGLGEGAAAGMAGDGGLVHRKTLHRQAAVAILAEHPVLGGVLVAPRGVVGDQLAGQLDLGVEARVHGLEDALGEGGV